ncbi:hypothetical protein D3OALGA1CA_5573 [Olavius algarvensis associated proteobacterium Delta 3]|nr:hypothetical protein D3OALGB2SA_5414 [Olavius algarvensis associated proteobacterium Delta 3]CAB5168695.1 hypothetical protein D3OALGA1CA_5573 [Olavius algarvensis associated proteobacterium Delta 3]
MSLQETLKQDLTAAMRERDDARKNTIRVIMGELGRQTKKTLSDEEIINIIKKLVKSETELLEKSGAAEESGYLCILRSYLPRMADDEDIQHWITANIDFSRFKNKMQAMGPIMKHFGAAADGNRVKEILRKL